MGKNMIFWKNLKTEKTKNQKPKTLQKIGVTSIQIPKDIYVVIVEGEDSVLSCIIWWNAHMVVLAET